MSPHMTYPASSLPSPISSCFKHTFVGLSGLLRSNSFLHSHRYCLNPAVSYHFSKGKSVSKSLLFHHPSTRDHHLSPCHLLSKWTTMNLIRTESPGSRVNIPSFLLPLEGQIAEPQVTVLKEQEGRVGGIKAIAMGLDGNHPGDSWNVLFIFSLLKYRLPRHMSGMCQTLKGQVNI